MCLYYSGDNDLPTVVMNLAHYKQEGTYCDFKRQWHENKADLVHDIICIANNLDGVTGLLIIGVDEEKGYTITGDADQLGHRLNTQNLIDMLRSKRWAEGMPLVHVVPIKLEEWCADVIVIEHDDESIPYYLTDDFRDGKSVVRAGVVYTRTADSNTPKTAAANPLETERLWRRRFGIDKTPLERLPQFLQEPAKWRQAISSHSSDVEDTEYCYYFIEHPEYSFVRKYDSECDTLEYFMLASPFFTGISWWTYSFYYHQTLILQLPGAYSDHLWIPAPRYSTVQPQNDEMICNGAVHSYAYFISGSIERAALLFELDKSKEGPSALPVVGMLDSLIPTFQDENERADFEQWVSQNWGIFMKRCNCRSRERSLPGGLRETLGERSDEVERQMTESAALVSLYREYNSCRYGNYE